MESIEKVISWVKALALCGFLVGGWCAGIQYQITGLRSGLDTLQKDREDSLKEWRAWREDMVRQQAIIATRQTDIDKKLDQIIDRQK